MLTENETTAGRLESLARGALEAYELPAPVTVRLLGQGLNTTFEVHAGDTRLVLRVHRPGYRTEENTRSELHFLRELGKRPAGARPMTPRPVPARNGALVVRAGDADGVEAPRHCDLATWVAGRELRPGTGLGLRRSIASDRR